jgi:excisionase family DNA binding protein
MIAHTDACLPATKPPPEQQFDDFVDSRTACRMLGIDRSTLKRWIKRGIIRYSRLPNGQLRFERQYILALLRSNGPRP